MLRINVIVDEVNDLKSDRNVCMITFHGDAESEYFKGKILPGGVDTQRSVEGGMLLSARYMLEGIDMKAFQDRERTLLQNQYLSLMTQILNGLKQPV